MKLTVVASCFGRAGTSALMGTLAQVGYDLGRSLKKKADINNPKGYFELSSQDELLSQVYPNFYKIISDNLNERKDRAPTPNEMSAVFDLARQYTPLLRKFLQREFVSGGLAAIKDTRLLLLPFIQLVQQEIHPKIIMMNRSIYGRALSSLQMLANAPMELANVDRDALVEYIKGWSVWGKYLRSNLDVPILDLRFESLIFDTKNAISAVAQFLDVPRIPLDQAARMFIEPGLTRRVSDPYLNLYYGQNGEDRVLWSLFKTGYCGKYIDVGALDGKVFSNTYSFDLAGWSGLCVEAHPDYTPSLRRNRSAAVVHAAATSKDSESIDFYAYPRGSLSTIHNEEIQYLQNRFHATSSWEKVGVPGRTINSMLQEANINPPIDVVSVDVEGAELDVMRGFDLNKYTPRVMVLEHMTAEKRQSVVQYLKGFGYIPAASISNNTFYCKKDDVSVIANVGRGKVCPVKTTHPLDR